MPEIRLSTRRRRSGELALRRALAAAAILLGGCGIGPRPVDVAAPPGADGVDWSGATRVAVQLVDDRFVPAQLRFRHGVPYHLLLENDGSTMHEFTAPDFFKAVRVGNPAVLEQGGGELLLQPHERKDLYFVAPAPGQFALSCADHDWDGMTGTITVE